MSSFPSILKTPLLHQIPPKPCKGGHNKLHDRRSLARSKSRADDELRNFRRVLRYLCADLTCFRLPVSATILSWIAFCVVAVVIPITFGFLLSRLRPYDWAVQIPLTLASGLAFNSLNTLSRKYGLRRSLFLDQLVKDSTKVQVEYTKLLHKALLTLVIRLLLPVATVDAFYKAYWYYCTLTDPSTAAQVPQSLTTPWMAPIMFTVELASFMYRVSVLFLDCVLFKLNCALQVLRMEDFTKGFHEEPDVVVTLGHHIRLRKQLRIISHRHRLFIISFLITTTASQFWTLLMTTRPHAQFNLFVGGELFLGGACLVGGILMCLGSAACITHKAQALTSHAATWHACATINPCEPSMAADVEANAATAPPTPTAFPTVDPTETITVAEGDECTGEDDDWFLELDKLLKTTTTAISYQKRQAIVTYLENNKGGITVYGFVVDRTWLHALFMIEFSLVMWLLGKTVGI
ncbi:hypothetical protein FCM35_KLT17255 [Carex littledalei]|uniref:Uncharacterized protein n=1 Tax=Carex littledalei TaxID=544730 RepID=A0A833REK5_9POAL|nr:hypothetical protein FCM35_KLT17255 [Carex littledalei]